MRLSNFQRNTIKQTARQHFNNQVKVKLFGLRVDDERKGGDIDLL